MITLDALSLFALGAVVLIGLPHGAMDAAVALALGYGRHPLRMTGFVGAYLLMAGAVIGAWMLAPVASLFLFLMISLVHFGLGDTEEQNRMIKLVQMLAHGSVVTIVIPLWHRHEVTLLFEVLSGPHALIWPMINGVAFLSVLAAGAYALLAFRHQRLRRGFAEYLILTALLIILPPLAGFAFYFTLVHTPRHLLRITAALKAQNPKLNVWGMTLLFTLATWAMAAGAYVLLADTVGRDAASLQIVFIGLAALTVPHMILIDGIFRPELNVK